MKPTYLAHVYLICLSSLIFLWCQSKEVFPMCFQLALTTILDAVWGQAISCLHFTNQLCLVPTCALQLFPSSMVLGMLLCFLFGQKYFRYSMLSLMFFPLFSAVPVCFALFPVYVICSIVFSISTITGQTICQVSATNISNYNTKPDAELKAYVTLYTSMTLLRSYTRGQYTG